MIYSYTNTKLYYATLHYTLLYSTLLYYTTLYSTLLYYTIPYHTILYTPAPRRPRSPPIAGVIVPPSKLIVTTTFPPQVLFLIRGGLLLRGGRLYSSPAAPQVAAGQAGDASGQDDARVGPGLRRSLIRLL